MPEAPTLDATPAKSYTDTELLNGFDRYPISAVREVAGTNWRIGVFAAGLVAEAATVRDALSIALAKYDYDCSAPARPSRDEIVAAVRDVAYAMDNEHFVGGLAEKIERLRAMCEVPCGSLVDPAFTEQLNDADER